MLQRHLCGVPATNETGGICQVEAAAVCLHHAHLAPGTAPVQGPINPKLREANPCTENIACAHADCINVATHMSLKLDVHDGLADTKFTAHDVNFTADQEELVADFIDQKGSGVRVPPLLHPALALHLKNWNKSPVLALPHCFWNNCSVLFCSKCHDVVSATPGFAADAISIDVTKDDAHHHKHFRCSAFGCIRGSDDKRPLNAFPGEIHMLNSMGMKCLDPSCRKCPGDRIKTTNTTTKRSEKKGLLTNTVPTVHEAVNPVFVPERDTTCRQKEHPFHHVLGPSKPTPSVAAGERGEGETAAFQGAGQNKVLVFNNGQKVDSEDSDEGKSATAAAKAKTKTGKKRARHHEGGSGLDH